MTCPLLVKEHLLSQLQPGLLSSQIEPLRSRIRGLLGHWNLARGEVIGPRSLRNKVRSQLEKTRAIYEKGL